MLYRRFIDRFSRIYYLLTKNLRKWVTFSWTKACGEASRDLKSQYFSATIVFHFVRDPETKFKTDTRDFAKSALLLQFHPKNKKWDLVAFYFNKFSQGGLQL